MKFLTMLLKGTLLESRNLYEEFGHNRHPNPQAKFNHIPVSNIFVSY